MAWDKMVPYLNGKRLSHDARWAKNTPGFAYRPVEEFTATLTFKRFARHNSNAFFADEKGEEYEMFLTDLTKIMPLLDHGKIKGIFTDCKRGSAYAIKLKSQ